MRQSFSRLFFMICVGVLVLGMQPRSVGAQEKFTLAVIPDSQQEILKADDDRLANRLQWLVAHRRELNLAMVLHVGDLLNWDTPDHIQYERASKAFKLLDDAGILYALTLGNHDTAATKEGGSAAPGKTNTNQRNTTTFNTYFPATRLKVVGHTYPDHQVENAYRVFHAGGLDWLVINLELWARLGAIDWARKVIDEHPHHNVILLTHAFLTAKGEIQADNGGYGDKSPRYIFENLIKPCANVRLVFSGHVGSHGYRTDQGEHGNTVYQFLQCYHDGTTNPVRLFEIDPKNKTIATRVYCPSIDQIKDDGSTLAVQDVEWVRPAEEVLRP
ncbi:MAG TPA: metallophosphoesterase [Tepidisphaeraceae bacterium]|nr:metallophosphoesterase [Tepidisphaeraceae bacterium]